MKSVLAGLFLIALNFPTTVSAQSIRDILGPSACSWATAPALRRLNISQDDIRNCVQGLIDSISELSKVREAINHEREMRGYLEGKSRDLQSDVDALNETVRTLRLEMEALRARLRGSK